MTVTLNLKPLKKWLEPGDIGMLAREVGISSVQASYIISGKCRNWDFVEKFLAKVERNKALHDKANSI